jgi:hypothetical protein
MAKSEFSKNTKHGFKSGAEYDIRAVSQINSHESSRFGKTAKGNAETNEGVLGFKVAKKEQKPPRTENAPQYENDSSIRNEIYERAVHSAYIPPSPTAQKAEEAKQSRFSAKSETFHTNEDKSGFEALKQQIFVAENSERVKESEPQNKPHTESQNGFTNEKAQRFVSISASEKSRKTYTLNRAVSKTAQNDTAVQNGVNAVIAAGQRAAEELRQHNEQENNDYVREAENRAKEGANTAYRAAKQLYNVERTAEASAKLPMLDDAAYRRFGAGKSTGSAVPRFGADSSKFTPTVNNNFAAQDMRFQEMQKAQYVKGFGAAASGAGETGAVAGATKAAASTAAKAHAITFAAQMAAEGAKKLSKENSSGMSGLMVAGVAGMFLLLTLPVIAFMIIAQAMYPFSYVYELVDELNDIWERREIATPREAIEVYIDIEKEIIDLANQHIAGLGGGGGEGGGSGENPMGDIDLEKWYEEGVPAYYEWWGEEVRRNAKGITTEFDYSPYQKEYPTYKVDDEGYIITDDGEGNLITESSKPDLPPKYEATIFYGTEKWGDFEFDHEGKTDAERVPEMNLPEILSTHIADRALNETEEDFMPDEFREAFDSYDLWEIRDWTEAKSCGGCANYTYTIKVTEKGYDEEGDWFERDKMVSGSGTTCPGHIFTVIDIQLDSDPIENIPDEYMSPERIQKKLWGYDKDLDPDGDGIDENGNTEGTLKEGQSIYKEILKQMKKDLEAPLPKKEEEAAE